MHVTLCCGNARRTLRLGEATPPTVAGLLEAVRRADPRLYAGWLDEEGRLRPTVSIYVNGENIRYRAGLATVLAAGDEITVIPLIAGG